LDRKARRVAHYVLTLQDFGMDYGEGIAALLEEFWVNPP
jgi:hypothetical protein